MPSSPPKPGPPKPGPGPIARFLRVSKTYAHGQPAVRNLDLDVAAGEFLTLLGPSGAGKTTILMMLAGFEAPSAGDIQLDGRSIARTPAHRRGIGVVFQSYALFPHMSVAENVAFPLRMRGLSRASQRSQVTRALDVVRLAGVADRRPAQLSGGQQQRTALARALVFQPRLVLLDEPLGALDRGLREELQHEIRRLHRQLGVTMLHVTHDQSEALTMSDRIAVLRDGVVQQVATPEALYENPANAFVAGFMGENNALPGVIEGIEDDIALIRLAAGALVEARLIEAPLAEAAAAGARCLATIRPERIAIAAVDAAEMGEGALPVQIREIIYQGDHSRLRVALADGAEVTVKRPAGAAMAGLAPGAAAAIAWQASHARAFLSPALRPGPPPG